MPTVSGIELCRRLKAQSGPTGPFPIVLVTAYDSDAALRASGLDAGAEDFLSKPIDRVELVAKVRVMLRIKAAEDELRRLNAHLEDVVTQRTQALRESEQQMRQAEKMAAIGELAAGIAHNFNNLLTPIVGNAQMLKSAEGITAAQAALIDEVIQAGWRASDLVDQLLAFARKGRFKRGPVDMHQVVREVAGLLRHTVDRRIDIRLDLRTESTSVIGDAPQLESALLNLGLNARDAMPAGGNLTFTLEPATVDASDGRHRRTQIKPGRYLHLAVADTGVGMNEQVRAHLFEPFFTTKPPGKGTGLGLASVYGCVKGHEGGIEVQSAPGRGTTVHLYLPAMAGEPEPAVAQATQAPPAAPARQGDAVASPVGRVLVVDENTPVCALVGRVLKRHGYAVTTCASASEAVAEYARRAREVDLVVLDFQMPCMDGLEAMRRIKAVNPDAHVLMTSLHDSQEAVSQAFGEGAIGVLSMPLEIDRLVETIARYVRLSEPSGAPSDPLVAAPSAGAGESQG
jgi:signal transduction histidine kinase/ActR/RegA family two-component response regulator